MEVSKFCPISGRWEAMKAQIESNTVKLDAVTLSIIELSKNAHYLSALPEIRDKLIASATGKDSRGADQISSPIFFRIITIFSFLLFSLVSIIAFLLIGENSGMIKGLYRSSTQLEQLLK